MTPTVCLTDVAEFVRDGTHGSPIRTEVGIPVLSAMNVKDGVLNFATDRFTSSAEYLAFSKRLPLTTGDVLLTIVGTIGRSAVVDQVVPLVFQRSVAVIRPRRTLMDSRFLYHVTKSSDFQNQLDRASNKSSQAGVYLGKLGAITVPQLALSEQRRIAAILDQADALRAKRREALAQLDSLTQSIFIEMFGDPVRNPKNWAQENLGDFFHFRTGKLDSNAAVENGEFPFFTCAKEDFRIDKFAFDCEALLLAGNNANADYSVKHYRGKFNAYQRTYVITLKKSGNSYKYAAFVLENQLAELKRMSKGSSTKYLTMELLNRIRIPVPPQNLQSQFANRMSATHKIRLALTASLAELNALFASLQHRAFAGQL